MKPWEANTCVRDPRGQQWSYSTNIKVVLLTLEYNKLYSFTLLYIGLKKQNLTNNKGWESYISTWDDEVDVLIYQHIT